MVCIMRYIMVVFDILFVFKILKIFLKNWFVNVDRNIIKLMFCIVSKSICLILVVLVM